MVLQIILLWTQLSNLLSVMSLWVSTGGRVPSGCALEDVRDRLLDCLRVRFVATVIML
jgi:hypothetical protein